MGFINILDVYYSFVRDWSQIASKDIKELELYFHSTAGQGQQTQRTDISSLVSQEAIWRPRGPLNSDNVQDTAAGRLIIYLLIQEYPPSFFWQYFITWKDNDPNRHTLRITTF